VSARRTTTILLVARDRIARAEVASKDAAPVLHDASHDGEAGAAELVEEAARLGGGGLRGPVWVVMEELFCQSVGLATAVVRDLPEEDLGKLLAYEAQSLSGLSAASAETAWRARKGAGRRREFVVAQMARSERDSVDDAVRRLGGRLAGIAHPAEAPAPQDDAAPWACPTEPEALARLMADLARRLAASDAIPTITPRERPLSLAGRAVATAAILCGALALCASHHAWLSGRREALTAELRTAQAPLETWRATQAEAARLDKEAKELEAAAARAQADLDGLAGSRRLPARLLGALARECPDGLTVEAIDVGVERSSIRGVCASPDKADALALALDRALADDRRRAGAPIRSVDAAGRYRFEILVTQGAALAPDAAAAPETGGRP